jgi:two-component system NarL family response regulator
MKKKNPIRVMLVDDHPAFRKGLAALVESEPDLEVVAQCGDGRQALATFREARPDVVLMDLRLPGLGGVEAILAIRQEFPQARVIVLTTFDTDEDIYRAIQSGAKSFLLKDTPEDELAATIRAVHAGEQKLPPKVADRLAARQQRAELSQREMEVLQLLVKGRSNKEISSALFVTEDTVKAHMKTLFSKLHVQDRTQAAVSAVRHGIVHLAESFRPGE